MADSRVPCGVREVCAFALLGVLAGCTGGGFGADLSARPKPRDLSLRSAVLQLPRDEPFSIRLPQSNQQSGLAGSADANATVSKDGAATARAKVDQGGSASGLFQIGHAFRNAGDRQMDVNFRVQFRYEYQVSAQPASALPSAEVGIRLYARDDRNRNLRDVSLVSHSSESGGASRRSTDDLEFSITLAPGSSVAVYLAGQARAETSEGHSGNAQLAVTDVQMHVSSVAAPAIQATTHVAP